MEISNEDYVSFEVAKMLKKKGFDWDCKTYYEVDKLGVIERESSNWEDFNTDGLEDEISRPTTQMANKWLREVKDIYVEVRRSLNTFSYGAFIFRRGKLICEVVRKFDSPEKAIDMALKEVLGNLIEDQDD